MLILPSLFSQTSSKRGSAGLARNGFCFKMFPSSSHFNSMNLGFWLRLNRLERITRIFRVRFMEDILAAFAEKSRLDKGRGQTWAVEWHFASVVGLILATLGTRAR